MRFLLTIGVFFLFLMILSGTLPFAGCSKKTIEHDTTIQIRHDTIVTHSVDTLTISDTVYELKDGLIAYYNFDSGNLNDSSGQNNNIVFSNALLADDRFGNPGNAYAFDGTSTYMRVSNSNSLNPLSGITLFAIVKVTGFYQGPCHGNQILVKASDDGLGTYGFGFNDPRIAGGQGCNVTLDTTREFFNGGYGDNMPIGSAASAGNDSFPYIHIGEWYTVAVTYDGATVKTYVNGALLETVSKVVKFTPNAMDLFIGENPTNGFPYYFHGIIDEIRIYNKAVPDSRIHILQALKTQSISQVARQ